MSVFQTLDFPELPVHHIDYTRLFQCVPRIAFKGKYEQHYFRLNFMAVETAKDHHSKTMEVQTTQKLNSTWILKREENPYYQPVTSPLIYCRIKSALLPSF